MMMDVYDCEDDENDIGVIFTVDEILEAGLEEAGYTKKRITRVKKKETNEQRFKDHYGANPVVCAQILEDLQRTKNPAARVDPHKLRLKEFLRAVHFLKRYPTESEREADNDQSKKILRERGWYYVEKIRELKTEKIVFPIDCEDIWILSIDGVQSRTNEPTHPTKSRDSKASSIKFKRSGLNCEIGLALATSNCVWVNASFLAGEPDHVTFVQRGLLDRIPEGKKIIADGVYKGHACVTWPNRLDDPEVAKFKRRARMRHEKFNGMLKEFRCIDVRFRHGKEKFEACFEAVCVICQYQMENGSPLFDILADGSDEAIAAAAAAEDESDD